MGLWHRQVFEKCWTPVKEAIAKGIAHPSSIRDVLLHHSTKYIGTDTDAMSIAMSTISAVLTFVPHVHVLGGMNEGPFHLLICSELQLHIQHRKCNGQQ